MPHDRHTGHRWSDLPRRRHRHTTGLVVRLGLCLDVSWGWTGEVEGRCCHAGGIGPNVAPSLPGFDRPCRYEPPEAQGEALATQSVKETGRRRDRTTGSLGPRRLRPVMLPGLPNFRRGLTPLTNSTKIFHFPHRRLFIRLRPARSRCNAFSRVSLSFSVLFGLVVT
jgi:hypothetical protein